MKLALLLICISILVLSFSYSGNNANAKKIRECLRSAANTNFISPLIVVPNVNVAKYMGRWYEISSKPAYFSKGCTCTQAFYTLLPNNTVEVRNACKRPTEITRIRGIATPVGPIVGGVTRGELLVDFFNGSPPGDYNIIGLDEVNYQYALVGSKSREGLFVLSRAQTLSDAAYKKLTDIASLNGFDLSDLNRTPQGCGPL